MGEENIIHENTLYAEPIAHVGSFPITNALATSTVALLIIAILAIIIRRNLKKVPTGLQNAMEIIIEGFLGIFDGVTGDRKKSLRFAPVVLAFFFFILINNWMGLLPGVGSIGQIAAEGGEKVFIPYLRGGTADLNTTLALATLGVVISHIMGVLAIGWWNYLNKFIKIYNSIKYANDIEKRLVHTEKEHVDIITAAKIQANLIIEEAEKLGEAR